MLRGLRPDAERQNWSPFGRGVRVGGPAADPPYRSMAIRPQTWVAADHPTPAIEPFRAPRVKNGEAVGRALDYLLDNNPQAFLLGLDVGVYGSAFKTCKGLIDASRARAGDRHAVVRSRRWWASRWGPRRSAAQPIFEFQFADFSTETVTQLGLNAGTWYFRTGLPGADAGAACPAAAG